MHVMNSLLILFQRCFNQHSGRELRFVITISVHCDIRSLKLFLVKCKKKVYYFISFFGRRTIPNKLKWVLSKDKQKGGGIL